MKTNSILLNIKHFISKNESKTTSSSEPEIESQDQDDYSDSPLIEQAEGIKAVKILANDLMTSIINTTEVYQNRILEANSVFKFIMEDDYIRNEYLGAFAEIFGRVNAYTTIIDDVTIKIDSILNGECDLVDFSYLSGSVGNYSELIVYTFTQVNSLLSDFDNYLAQIQQWYEDDSSSLKSDASLTIH